MNITSKEIRQALTEEEFDDMVESNMAVKGILVGYVAEQRLLKILRLNPEFISVTKIPDKDALKGDILVQTSDSTFTIEVKCVGSSVVKEDLLSGGLNTKVCLKASDKIVLSDGETTSCAEQGLFDILAICMVTITGTWDYLFIHNRYLPVSNKYPGRLKSTISINTKNMPCLHSDINEVIRDLD